MQNTPLNRIAAYFQTVAFAAEEDKPSGTYAAFRVHPQTAKAIRGWARRNGIENPYPLDELHVTTVYAEDAIPYEPAGVLDKPLQAQFRGFKLFGEDNESLVAHIEHPVLHARHGKAKKLGMTWKFPNYTPHITISSDHSLTADRLSELTPLDFPILLHEEYANPLEKDWKAKVTAALLPNGWEHVRTDERGRELYRNDAIDMDACVERRDNGSWAGEFKTRTNTMNFGPTKDLMQAFQNTYERMDIKAAFTVQPDGTFAEGDSRGQTLDEEELEAVSRRILAHHPNPDRPLLRVLSKYLRDLKSPVGGQNMAELHIDPKTAELRGMCKKNKAMRGLFSPDHLWVWRAHDMTHAEMQMALQQSGEFDGDPFSLIKTSITAYGKGLEFGIYPQDVNRAVKLGSLKRYVAEDPQNNEVMEM